MTDAGASLITAFDYVLDRLARRLDAMTDAEYLWEPVDGCWSLRPGPDGRWRQDGMAHPDGQPRPSPEPPPLTTLAWRVAHLGSVLGGFAERLFGAPGASGDGDGGGDGRGTSPSGDLDLPISAAAVPVFLARNYRSWRTGLTALEPPDWQRPLGASFAPYADDTVFDLALHVFDEVVHHGAEVGVLRDLWAHRHPDRPS